MNDERQIKSYVFYEGNCFFVSTIERDSSAMEGPGRYNETIVWNFDWGTNKRGDQIYMDEACTGSLATHEYLCRELYKHGKIEDSD